MKHGPTTGKERFENQVRDMIYRECRRRKTGRQVILRHVVRLVNEFMLGESEYRYRLVERNK